jgi:hypothetical protein
MKNNVAIDSDNISIFLSAIEESLAALTVDLFEDNLDGVLKRKPDWDELTNAYNFLCQHYNTIQSSIRLNLELLTIVNKALENATITFDE